MENPWLDILAPQRIAQCDNAAISGLSSQTKMVLNLDRIPEPFTGSPSAPVYLLCGNPGEPDDPNICKADKQIVDRNIDMFEKNLRHEPLVTDTNFIYLTNQMKGHSGYDWWQKRTVALADAIGHTPELFAIEYFPYHSTQLTKIPKNTQLLPSYEYSNELIKAAMKEGKVIIVTRMKKEWFERIDGLDSYVNLLVLSSPQNISITPQNVMVNDKKMICQNKVAAKMQGWQKLLAAYGK